MKTIRNWLLSLTMVMAMGGVLLTSAVPQTAYAADACNKGFLGFPAWYRGLTDGDCNIKSPGDDLSGFVWHIALNCIEIALVSVAYIATFFILYAGFMMIVNSGSSDIVAKSRQTILNAVIGLVISIAAVSIVNLIAGII